MLSNHAAPETSMQSLQVQDSIMKMKNADLEMFKHLLYSDWGKIPELMTRHNASIDLLLWLQARHCSQQGKLAKDPCFIRKPCNLNKNNINVLEGAHRAIHGGPILFPLLHNRL